MEFITVSGAYGRDYPSRKAAIAAWFSGADFVIRSIMHGPGRYISCRDELPAGTRINIRYRNDTQIVPVPSKPPKGMTQ